MFRGLGRYDDFEGAVPLQQRKEDARTMGWQHGAEICAWNIGKQHTWEASVFLDVDFGV